MTVTLQDVSCLWALPIQGTPVTGVSDSNWSGLVDECLGVGAASELLKRKKRSGTASFRFFFRFCFVSGRTNLLRPPGRSKQLSPSYEMRYSKFIAVFQNPIFFFLLIKIAGKIGV